MTKKQKKYTPEFRQQMVDLYNSGTKSYNLMIWKAELRIATSIFPKLLIHNDAVWALADRLRKI